MKNNKIFSVWLREICSLIFVQSIQAFLVAIMLVVVIELYISSLSGNGSGLRAMGIYAIIILSMIPKVELLVKKIFGLGSGVMDESMMGGKRSLLKSGLAIRGAMSVLNNGGKIAGGLLAMGSTLPFGSAGKQARIAKNNMEAADSDRRRLGLNSDNSNNSGNSRNVTSTRRRSLGAASPSSGSSNGGSLGNLGAADLAEAIKKANASDPQEEYEKARHQLSQKRWEGLKQATSGVFETVGAIEGAAAGAIVGLGTGGDDVLQDMGIGMGIGDQIGSFAADATVGNAGRLSDWSYNRRELGKKLAKSESKKSEAEQRYNETVQRVSGSGTSAGSQPVRLRATNGTLAEAQRRAESRRNNTTTRNVQPPRAATSYSAARGTIKNVAAESSKSKSSQLTQNQKQYYEKAKAAKAQGDMTGYKQNMGIVAGMRKQEKSDNKRTITRPKAEHVPNPQPQQTSAQNQVKPKTTIKFDSSKNTQNIQNYIGNNINSNSSNSGDNSTRPINRNN